MVIFYLRYFFWFAVISFWHKKIKSYIKILVYLSL